MYRAILLITINTFLSLPLLSQDQFWSEQYELEGEYFACSVEHAQNSKYLLISNLDIDAPYEERKYRTLTISSPNIKLFNEVKFKLIGYNEYLKIDRAVNIQLEDEVAYLLAADVEEDAIILVYTSIDKLKNKYKLKLRRYDFIGKLLEERTLDQIDNKTVQISLKRGKRFYKLFPSTNSDYRCIRRNAAYTIYDKNFQVIYSAEEGEKEPIDIKLNEEYCTILFEGKTYLTLVNYDLKKKERLETRIQTESSADFNIALFDQSIYLIHQYSESKKNNQLAFFSTGVEITQFSVKDLQQASNKKVAFDNETLTSISKKKNSAKISGLKDLSIKGVHFSAQGEALVVLQQHVVMEPVHTPQVSWGTLEKYGAILSIKAALHTGETKQLVISNFAQGMDVMNQLFSVASIFKNNQLFLYYNSGNDRYTFNTTILSEDLQLEKSFTESTLRTNGLYLELNTMKMVEEKALLFVGRYQKYWALCARGF